jgi:hypothetical protein
VDDLESSSGTRVPEAMEGGVGGDRRRRWKRKKKGAARSGWVAHHLHHRYITEAATARNTELPGDTTSAKVSQIRNPQPYPATHLASLTRRGRWFESSIAHLKKVARGDVPAALLGYDAQGRLIPL